MDITDTACTAVCMPEMVEHLSVCVSHQQHVAGLLLSALWAGNIDRQQAQCSAANAGSVILTAEE